MGGKWSSEACCEGQLQPVSSAEVTVTNYAEEARRVRKETGGGPCICILGSVKFQQPESEELVRNVARAVSRRIGRRASIVTGGMSGVQESFASNCVAETLTWNLLPKGQDSHFTLGRTLYAGSDLADRKEIFGLVGDIYISVEGGPGVAQEARAAISQGAVVIPLIRTGGASSGMFDFPPKALEKPSWCSKGAWQALEQKDASPAEVGDACASLVDFLIGLIEKTNQSDPTGNGVATAADKVRRLRMQKRLFEELDLNGDQALSMEEFTQMFRRVQPQASTEVVKQIFACIDTDSSKTVSIEEFETWLNSEASAGFKEAIAALTSGNHVSINRIFKLMDADGNGTLSQAEVMQVMLATSNLPAEEADRIFKAIDADHDGKIDFDEFADSGRVSFSELAEVFGKMPTYKGGSI